MATTSEALKSPPVFTLSSASLDYPQEPPLPSKQPKTTILSHRYRYFVLILGCLCLTSNSSNMITMNFTMICMFKSAPNDANTSAPELASHIPQYYYTQHEKSMLIWAVAVGSMIATFPFSVLYSKYGARYVFFAAGVISSLSTLLIPYSAEMGLYWILTMRTIQGIAYAADFAAIGVLCSRWASLKQNGVFIAFLVCFTPFSSAVTNPVAGALCESRFGWPAVYYSHGFASLILFTLWVVFYTDHPETHRAVSSVELEKIHRHKSEAHIKADSFTPYKAILSTPIIWIIWLNAFVDIGATIFFLTYVPTYINNALHYPVAKTGFLGALPAMVNVPFKLASGYLSDNIKFIDERKKLIIFNSLALFVPGIMLICLGFVPDDAPMVAVILVALINGFLGGNCGGFYKCGTLVSRQFSHFIISNIQFLKCIAMCVAPGLVAFFVTDDSNKSQWQSIFLIIAAANIIANAVFCYYATDKPADFTLITRQSYEQENLEKHKTNVIFDVNRLDSLNNNAKVG